MPEPTPSPQKEIDELLNSLPANIHTFFMNYYFRSKMFNANQRSMVISYTPPEVRLLADLCDKYGSDKGSNKEDGHPYNWTPHTYTDYYSMILLPQKEKIKNVFECGIGTNNPNLQSNMTATGVPGASLRVWRDFFPNANIIGVDIDKDILFEEERIQTFWIDQTSPQAIHDFFESTNVESFDLMIDDGLHTFGAARCLFRNSIHKLADDGIYIIEDLSFDDVKKFEKYANRLKGFYVESIFLFQEKEFSNGNNLICIRKQRT